MVRTSHGYLRPSIAYNAAPNDLQLDFFQDARPLSSPLLKEHPAAVLQSQLADAVEVLRRQKEQALVDLDTLAQAKREALADPEGFVARLRSNVRTTRSSFFALTVDRRVCPSFRAGRLSIRYRVWTGRGQLRRLSNHHVSAVAMSILLRCANPPQ